MAFIKIARGILAVAALSLVMSCSENLRAHGYVPRQDQLSEIAVGKDTRETVLEKIGAPNTGSLRRKDAWYYVQSKFRHAPFVAPQEIERVVLRITFNANGRVRNIERFGMADGRVILLNARVTETVATDRGFLKQIFSNLGSGADPAALLN